MAKTPRGGDREPRPTKISQASAAERNHLASTRRLGKKIRAIEAALGAVYDNLDEYRKQGVEVDPEGVKLNMVDGKNTYTFNLPGLEQTLQGMKTAAEGRKQTHRNSRNRGIRRSAQRALQADKPLSKEADEALTNDIIRLSDNY